VLQQQAAEAELTQRQLRRGEGTSAGPMEVAADEGLRWLRQSNQAPHPQSTLSKVQETAPRAANLWFSFRSEKVFKKALLLLARGRQRSMSLKTLYTSTGRRKVYNTVNTQSTADNGQFITTMFWSEYFPSTPLRHSL
jgi:hypothetical protein